MKKNLLNLALLVFSFHLQAQDAYYATGLFNQQLPLRHPSTANGNSVLQLLAEGNGKHINSVNLQFSFRQEVTLYPVKSGVRMDVTASNLIASGDLFYKGFKVANEVLPDRLRFTVLLYKNSNLYKQFQFNDVVVNEGDIKTVSQVFADSTPELIRSEIKMLIVEYTVARLNRFKQRVNLINDYYNASVQLDHASMLVQSVNFNNVDYFNEEKQKLHDARSILSSIEHCGYNAALNLAAFDPAQLQHKMSLVGSMIGAKEHELQQASSTLYLSLFERGMFFMQNGNFSKAEGYFLRSIEANHSFAPALFQLARIDFNRNDLYETTCKLDIIFTQLYADPQTKDDALNLAKDVHEAYLDKGIIKLNKREYQKALEYFEQAQELCEKYRGVRCSDELLTNISKAHNGVYQHYLEDAREHLQTGDWTKAEEQTSKAINYQRKQKTYIATNADALQVLKGIKQKQYDYAIQKAKLAADEKNYSEVLQQLSNADNLKNEFDLVADKNFSAMQNAAARALIAQHISTANQHADRNELVHAKSVAGKVVELQNQYSLSSDKELNKQVELLRTKIFSQQCINAQNEFDNYYNQAKQFVAEKNYRKADEHFNNAKNVAEKNPDCSVNTRTILADHSTILPAATYLKLVDRAKVNQRDGNYRKCIEDYNEAGKYFGQFDVGSFGLQHAATDEYILNGNGGLLYYAGDMYTDKNELEKALLVYKALYLKQYQPSVLKGSLYTLGVKLGLRDKIQHAGDKDWKKHVLNYTAGDKKWKSLEKGFKKGWKS